MNKKNKTYRDYLLSLLSLLNATEEISINDIDEVLIEAGYKPDEIGRKFQAVANKALEKSPHNWRNRARVEHEEAKSIFRNTSQTNNTRLPRSELLEKVNNLLLQEKLNIAPVYRNLTGETDEDLESFLRQLEYIIAQRSKKQED